MAELDDSVDVEMLKNRYEESVAANEDLKHENEALEELMEQVHDLAEDWQEVLDRKRVGEPIEEALEALRQRRQRVAARLAEINRGDLGPRRRRSGGSQASPVEELTKATEESQVLKTQNQELKEAIQQARSMIHSKLDLHQAEHLGLKTDRQELKDLLKEETHRHRRGGS
ncbi:Uncharacterized protein SCF082_LOCUS12420 [Durusdinium trenchii]|uniref:Uncharacterized protein n=1 Tax=Durusdinium trenchii TaxID=1381693 RepID=A0ABP0JJS1_9DINO